MVEVSRVGSAAMTKRRGLRAEREPEHRTARGVIRCVWGGARANTLWHKPNTDGKLQSNLQEKANTEGF